MNQFLSQFLLEIQQDTPSKVPEARWNSLAEYLNNHPEEKEEIHTEVERVLDDNGLAAPAYANWIYALYQKANPQEAIRAAVRGDLRYPNTREILILWGMALRRAEDVEGAITKYQQANALKAGKDFDALYNSGNALLSRDLPRAIDFYEQAIGATSAPPAKALYALAFALQRKNRLDEAVLRFEQASKAGPDQTLNRDIYLGWGKALLDLGKVEQAAEKYAEISRSFPDDATIHFAWGVALQQAGKLSDAAVRYEIATQKKKSYPDAYYNWGLVLHDLGKLNEAVNKYELAAKSKEGGYADAYYNWGLILQNQRDWSGAIEKYRLATESKDRKCYAEAYYNWGMVLQNVRDWSLAAQKYRLATCCNKEFADAYCNGAFVLIQCEERSQAIERCDRAFQLYQAANNFPGQATALYYWGLALEKDSPKDAEVKYEAAAAADAQHIDALFAWGNLLLRQRKEEAAIRKWQKAVERKGSFAYAWHNIADLYHRQGRYELSRTTWLRAKEAYELAAKETENSCNSYLYYAFATVQYQFLGDSLAAEQNYRRACQLDPEFAGPRSGLVRLYLDLSQRAVEPPKAGVDGGASSRDWRAGYAAAAREAFAESDDLLAKAINQLPAPNETALEKEMKFNALLQRGDLHLTMREFDTAKKFLERAKALQPQSGVVRGLLGILYSWTGETENAVASFEAAVRAEPFDLDLRSNLAGAYQRQGRLDRATDEYHKILEITPDHVQTRIGLGETCIGGAEKGRTDLFDQAIIHLGKAIELAESKQGSDRLSDRELAAVYYSKGFAEYKLAEKSSLDRRDSLYNAARDDFEMSCNLDGDNRAASDAKQGLGEKTKLLSRQSAVERFGPFLIVLLSAYAFLMIQTSFFVNWPIVWLEPGYYALLSFGMLTFMIAGLYLPQILKIEVGGVKLEKSVVEQAAKTSLAITLEKIAQRNPSLSLPIWNFLPTKTSEPAKANDPKQPKTERAT